jgi:hypothetical protein
MRPQFLPCIALHLEDDWYMRTRTLLIASLATNLLLVLAWYSYAQNAKKQITPPQVKKPFNPFEHDVKTKVIVRRLNFTWHEVESADYAAYIQNLREIGCPEQTITDIIVADVNQLYAHRREQEILPAEFQWWRSELDPEIQRNNLAKSKALDTERKAMLDRLLGANWERTQDDGAADPQGINLNGAILGELSPEVKQQVYEINRKARQQMKQLEDTAEKNGSPLDLNAMMQIRQHTRADLARILNPAQMEEFLLRYSETAKRMREEFHGLTVTPEEFRTLFRARDTLENQAAVYTGSTNDARSLGMQQALDAQREALLKSTLGTDRYNAYKLNQDPLYQQAQITAQQAGVAANLVRPIYEINQTTEAELVRIQNDATMTAEQQGDAIIAAEADRERSLEQVLGSEAYQKMQLQQIFNPNVAPAGLERLEPANP